MTQSLAITDYIDSLAEVEARFGLSFRPDPDFFTEWTGDRPPLTTAEQQRLDLIKQRYLYHRQLRHLLEGAVNFIVIAPLLELAGFYDPPFRLRSEASIQIEIADEEDKLYQGRIDSLIVQERLWIVLVEAKRTFFSIDVALPQALAYMFANPSPELSTFGLVSNGAYSMFVKLQNQQYGFSEDFSLNRQRNKLHDVLQILNRLKIMI
ncbi:MAG TPA: type I restriction endonuclease subunit R [Leptolyngbyaceae cyanobacterium M33_DOE_097]|uniref:Type I restriction endonuclease subunit R n=1 Tax=Oscillatoriales cyanobacterium SpSt-418 TaxID=2282169 RepID=A0A7C3PG53_9CYAN|nr:type I restriction endonuclease subunit R [Leptolyngbyaceae cyanobacterium M33_DOE_097]